MNGLQWKLTGRNRDNARIPLINDSSFFVAFEFFDFARERGRNSRFNLPALFIDVDLLFFLRPVGNPVWIISVTLLGRDGFNPDFS